MSVPATPPPNMDPVAHWEFQQLKDDLFGTPFNPQRGKLVLIEGKIDDVQNAVDRVLARRAGLMSNIEKTGWAVLGIVIAAVVLALLHLANPAFP